MKHKTFLISIVFSIVLVVSCAPATDVEYDQVISTQSHVKGNEQITSTPMQCGNNHMFYPFDEKISTTSIRDFYFSNDNEVYFSVWNYKEYSTDLAHLDSYQVQSDINVLPKDNTQTFKLGLDRIGLNLTTGYFAQPAISPIYDICESGDCPIVDVLSSSPNKKWQLAQITEGIAHGVWLLGENSATHLLPFLPGSYDSFSNLKSAITT